MKLYLGGPMRGYVNYNFDEFDDGKQYLESLDYDVISPHEIDISEGLVSVDAHFKYRMGELDPEDPRITVLAFDRVDLTDKFTIEDALRRDIAAILECDGVAFLEGWRQSEGCKVEDKVRQWMGLPRYHVVPWQSVRRDFGAQTGLAA